MFILAVCSPGCSNIIGMSTYIWRPGITSYMLFLIIINKQIILRPHAMFPDGPLSHEINAAFYCCSYDADVSLHALMCFRGLELLFFLSFFFFLHQFMAGLWIEEVLNECFKIAVGKSHLATVKKTHFVVDSIEMQPRQIGFFLRRVYFPPWWFLRYKRRTRGGEARWHVLGGPSSTRYNGMSSFHALEKLFNICHGGHLSL